MTDNVKNTIIIKKNAKTRWNHFFKDFQKGIRADCYETATRYTREEAQAIVDRTPVDYDKKIIGIVLYTFEEFCHKGINCQMRYRDEPFYDWIGVVLIDKGHLMYGLDNTRLPDDMPTHIDVCQKDDKERWCMSFDNKHIWNTPEEGEKWYIERKTKELAHFIANYRGENYG